MNTEPNQLGKANFEGYYKDYPEPVPHWGVTNQKRWQQGGEAAVRKFLENGLTTDEFINLGMLAIHRQKMEHIRKCLLSRLAAPMQGSPEVAPEPEWEEAYGDVAKANGWRWQETEAKSMTGKWHPMDLMYPFQDGRLYRRLKRPTSPKPTSAPRIETPAGEVEWEEATGIEAKLNHWDNKTAEWKHPSGHWLASDLKQFPLGWNFNDGDEYRRPIPRQPAGEVKMSIHTAIRMACESLVSSRDFLAATIIRSMPLEHAKALEAARSQIEALQAELAEARREVEQQKQHVLKYGVVEGKNAHGWKHDFDDLTTRNQHQQETIGRLEKERDEQAEYAFKANVELDKANKELTRLQSQLSAPGGGTLTAEQVYEAQNPGLKFTDAQPLVTAKYIRVADRLNALLQPVWRKIVPGYPATYPKESDGESLNGSVLVAYANGYAFTVPWNGISNFPLIVAWMRIPNLPTEQKAEDEPLVTQLEDSLRCVLPMAKGWCKEHNVGSNQRIVEQAEARLRASQGAGKEGKQS